MASPSLIIEQSILTRHSIHSLEGTLVRIIAVGGAGTIGRAVVELLSARHDVVVAGRSSGDVHVDIRSPDSVRLMYEQVGSFDALVCTAG